VQHRPYHAKAKNSQEQVTYPSVSAAQWLGDGSSIKYRVCLSNAWGGSASSCGLLSIPAETADCALIYCTVRTEIIENGAKTSRISGFGLGGENRARGFSFSPHLRHRPY